MKDSFYKGLECIFDKFPKYNMKLVTSEKREYNEIVHQLFIDFKKAYDLVRREVKYL
jgi:hypothetical protein